MVAEYEEIETNSWSPFQHCAINIHHLDWWDGRDKHCALCQLILLPMLRHWSISSEVSVSSLHWNLLWTSLTRQKTVYWHWREVRIVEWLATWLGHHVTLLSAKLAHGLKSTRLHDGRFRDLYDSIDAQSHYPHHPLCNRFHQYLPIRTAMHSFKSVEQMISLFLDATWRLSGTSLHGKRLFAEASQRKKHASIQIPAHAYSFREGSIHTDMW